MKGMQCSGNLETRKMVSYEFAALFPRNLDFLFQKTPFFLCVNVLKTVDT